VCEWTVYVDEGGAECSSEGFDDEGFGVGRDCIAYGNFFVLVFFFGGGNVGILLYASYTCKDNHTLPRICRKTVDFDFGILDETWYDICTSDKHSWSFQITKDPKT